jgi:hypothetical protein
MFASLCAWVGTMWSLVLTGVSMSTARCQSTPTGGLPGQLYVVGTCFALVVVVWP